MTNRDRIIYALIAVLLGGSGAAGIRAIDPPRPDPWTGTQAREAHASLQLQIDAIEQALSDFRVLATHNFTLRDQMFHDIKRLEKKVYGHE